MTSYWAVAQTVSKMEHLVRRDIEKTNHGAFLPTYAKHWKVDDRDYSKEYPVLTGYVFFKTKSDDWAGIPDIHGVYRVMVIRTVNPATGKSLSTRDAVSETEMARLMFQHAAGDLDTTEPPRFTRYYRPQVRAGNGQFKRKYRRPRPRPGKRLRQAMRDARNLHAQ